MTDINCGAIQNWLAKRLLQANNSTPSFLLLSLSLPLLAVAAFASSQPAQAAPGGLSDSGILIAQVAPAPAPIHIDTSPPTSTILPTDVLPLPNIQNRMTFGENMQLRILQKLPSRFYFTTSVETSFRLETNPFQDPNKSILERHTFTPAQFFASSPAQQLALINLLKQPNSFDNVYRVLPNVTAGWTLTPTTRVYGNFFTIRDSLFKNIRLNTDIYSYSYGVQHDFKIGSRANLQADVQARELNQIHQHSVFDFLPGLTLTYIATPRTVAYVNALLQIRGRSYFQAPTRELDPFYTWGMLHQRGRWTFSASTTFVQNFREQFGNRAVIPQNNYAFISDYEIARRIIPQVPGLQAFIRAEPIWNIHSKNRAGLSGFDFRLYYGLRFTASKPALTSALDSLRKQLEEQEVEPPKPQAPPKPSAYVLPQEVTAQESQPMHGSMSDNKGTHAAADQTVTASADAQPAAPVKHKAKKAKTKTTVAAKPPAAVPAESATGPAGDSHFNADSSQPNATVADPGMGLRPAIDPAQANPTKPKSKSAFAKAVRTPVKAHNADRQSGDQSTFSKAMMFDSSDAQKVVDPGVDASYRK
jgi:hypothetical protein